MAMKNWLQGQENICGKDGTTGRRSCWKKEKKMQEEKNISEAFEWQMGATNKRNIVKSSAH